MFMYKLGEWGINWFVNFVFPLKFDNIPQVIGNFHSIRSLLALTLNCFISTAEFVRICSAYHRKILHHIYLLYMRKWWGIKENMENSLDKEHELGYLKKCLGELNYLWDLGYVNHLHYTNKSKPLHWRNKYFISEWKIFERGDTGVLTLNFRETFL